MPFGILPAPEELQRRLIQVLEGLDGIMSIFDGTLVFGVGEDQNQNEAVRKHDSKLRALFERYRAKGIKLNKLKTN